MSIVKKSEEKYPSVFSDLFDYDKFFGRKFFNDMEVNLPAANVKETDKGFKIEVSIPGFKKEDIKVSLDNDVLSISAEAQTEKSEGNEKYTRKEFSKNSVSRSFQLPQIANSDKVDAKYENGILKLEIAKKEEAINNGRKKQISVA